MLKLSMAVNYLCLIILIFCWARFAGAADFTNQQPERTNASQFPSNTLQLYQKEVLRHLLKEVNEVAQVLKLEENSPIVESNLLGKFIAPASFSSHYGGLGSLKTENYAYAFAKGHQLSFVIGTHQAQDCANWERDYLWPKTRMDTNSAYLLAVEWLKAFSIDVEGLNRDHRLRIEPDKIHIRPQPDTFVPAYWVSWYKRSDPDRYVFSNSESEPVASIFLFVPSKKLLQLRVEDSNYNLRKQIQITNAAMFSPTQ